MVEFALQTERLKLRRATADDAASIAKFMRDNEERIRCWSPARTEEFYTEGYWRERAVDEANGASFRFLAFREEALAASVILRDVRFGPNRCAELGYTVDAHHAGQGIATEAATAVLTYAFDELCLHRIEATYMPANRASARVLDKLGFTPEGLLRDMLLVNGRWEDHVIASLLHPEVRPHG
jgi:ribosomal-protein-alanine N-acetyltransferase